MQHISYFASAGAGALGVISVSPGTAFLYILLTALFLIPFVCLACRRHVKGIKAAARASESAERERSEALRERAEQAEHHNEELTRQVAELERANKSLSESEGRLRYAAFHDPLTGLPNRALFIEQLKQAVGLAKRHKDYSFAVLFLDLDRFKYVNDSLGHNHGDDLLVAFSRRLQSCLRRTDIVARFGGDEFAVLLNYVKDPTDVIRVAEKVQQALLMPFNLDGQDAVTTASIGIALSAAGYDLPEDVLRDADIAMYRAKDNGKARYEVFDETMHARAVSRLRVESDLRRAVERQEFRLHYQPIVALEDFRLRGFEALVRWKHPERGLIPPGDFIPVAEETGLIQQIGEWVLREACCQMKEWQMIFRNDPPLFVSVNLSGKQFAQADLTEKVAGTLRETGIEPQSLKLEITESVVMGDREAATETLRQLRALGIQLGLDDFGTGYSSLSYLHRFHLDTLKVDRSFVTQMMEQAETLEIVRTVITLAQTLGMDVVAEGVETNQQLALLRQLGCENGQGYYFSKPVEAVEAEKIIIDTHPSLMSELLLNDPQFDAAAAIAQ